MESIIQFVNILAAAGVAVSAFMVFMYMYADYALNHTKQGEVRQLLAKMEGKEISIKPVGKYVFILIVSSSWLIAQWWT